MRARRTCLVVPAVRERMIEKAAGLALDEVVIDLEDAVPPAEKTDATRRRVVAALREREWRARTVGVRLNAADTEWFERDAELVVGEAGPRLDVVVLPKVESAEALLAAERLLPGVAIEAQIESARGLVEVERIAAASTRLEALVFGPGDYAASLGLPQLEIGVIDADYPGDQWHYAKARLANAAHAFGLDPVDGPYSAFRDLAGLREAARRARALGFVGKWAIHPDQTDAIAEAFTPPAEQVERARLLLAALAEAEADGRGAAVFDGAMIDEASRKMAEAIVARAGVTA